MTQIVYDGRFLLADQKCFRGNAVIRAPKLCTSIKYDVQRYWSFSGSFLECTLGDAVVSSGFDESEIERVRQLMPYEDLHKFLGLMVEVTADGRKVYLLNYAGDRCEVPNNQFIVVGAMHQEITYAYQTWQQCATALNVDPNTMFCQIPDDEDAQLLALSNFLRFTLSGTEYDQAGWHYDCYDFAKDGKYRWI